MFQGILKWSVKYVWTMFAQHFAYFREKLSGWRSKEASFVGVEVSEVKENHTQVSFNRNEEIRLQGGKFWDRERLCDLDPPSCKRVSYH